MHIYEGSLGTDLPVYVGVDINDGAGNLLSRTNHDANWEDVLTVPGSDTSLPWDVSITLRMSRTLDKRSMPASRHAEYLSLLRRRDPELAEILRRDPFACTAKREARPQGCGGAGTLPPDPYEDWLIQMQAGDSSWNSGDQDEANVPFCRVGGWDNADALDFIDLLTSLGVDQKMPNRQMDCYFPC